jgi:hypothetical protein
MQQDMVASLRKTAICRVRLLNHLSRGLLLRGRYASWGHLSNYLCTGSDYISHITDEVLLKAGHVNDIGSITQRRYVMQRMWYLPSLVLLC